MRRLLAALCIALPCIASAAAPVVKEFKGTPTLMLFWRSDCAPCMQEVSLIPTLAHAHPDTQFVVVSLQGLDDAHAHLPVPMPANVRVAHPAGGADIMERLGNKRMVLPFSVFLHKDGSVCRARMGILGISIVDDWAAKC